MTDTIKPVAWVEVIDTDEGPYNFHGIRLLPKGRHHLYGPDVAALVQSLRDALAGIDEAYCRAGSPLTRDERTEDRKRLMAARQSAAAADAFLAQHNPAPGGIQEK